MSPPSIPKFPLLGAASEGPAAARRQRRQLEKHTPAAKRYIAEARSIAEAVEPQIDQVFPAATPPVLANGLNWHQHRLAMRGQKSHDLFKRAGPALVRKVKTTGGPLDNSKLTGRTAPKRR